MGLPHISVLAQSETTLVSSTFHPAKRTFPTSNLTEITWSLNPRQFFREPLSLSLATKDVSSIYLNSVKSRDTAALKARCAKLNCVSAIRWRLSPKAWAKKFAAKRCRCFYNCCSDYANSFWKERHREKEREKVEGNWEGRWPSFLLCTRFATSLIRKRMQLLPARSLADESKCSLRVRCMYARVEEARRACKEAAAWHRVIMIVRTNCVLIVALTSLTGATCVGDTLRGEVNVSVIRARNKRHHQRRRERLAKTNVVGPWPFSRSARKTRSNRKLNIRNDNTIRRDGKNDVKERERASRDNINDNAIRSNHENLIIHRKW